MRLHLRQVHSSAGQPVSGGYAVSSDVQPAQVHHPLEISLMDTMDHMRDGTRRLRQYDNKLATPPLNVK